MTKKDAPAFMPREGKLHDHWKDRGKVKVNNQQHSYDTPERQEAFTKALCVTDDERERYQIYRKEWFRRPNEYDHGPAPLAVTCELVSTCNLGCTMCYTITPEFQSSVVGAQRMLPWPVVKAVIDECVELGVPSMLFSWRGESSMYRSKDENGNTVTFPDVLRYAREAGILEVTSLSNGQLLSPEMIEAIVDADPSWINFSIDGMERSYNQIRTPSSKQGTDYNAFQRIVENIRLLIKLRDEKGRSRPQIRTNTIFPPISDNPEAYYDFFTGLGVGWLTVNEIQDYRGEEMPEEDILPDFICQYPWQRLTVAANGSILPCTGAHNEEHDLLLGRYPGCPAKEITKGGVTTVVDLPVRTIAEVWESPELNQIRATHKDLKRTDIKACKHCRHGAVKHGVEWIPDDWDMESMTWKDGVWRE